MLSKECYFSVTQYVSLVSNSPLVIHFLRRTLRVHIKENGAGQAMEVAYILRYHSVMQIEDHGAGRIHPLRSAYRRD